MQFDEKWSFVANKEKHCDREDPADDLCGDFWDHVALDAESRLVLSVVAGKQSPEHTLLLVEDVHRRTGGALHLLLLDEDSLLDERIFDLLEGGQDGLAVTGDLRVVPRARPLDLRLERAAVERNSARAWLRARRYPTR